MTAKLRIRTKGIEIEWEGEAEFLKSELPDLIASIIEAIGSGAEDEGEEEVVAKAKGDVLKFTTAAAAAKVQPKSAAELLKVALAKLQLSDGIEPATRAQVHNEMKAAPKFYKPSMRNNLNSIIDSLLGSGEVNEPTSGNYALSLSAQQDLQTKLES